MPLLFRRYFHVSLLSGPTTIDAHQRISNLIDRLGTDKYGKSASASPLRVCVQYLQPGLLTCAAHRRVRRTPSRRCDPRPADRSARAAIAEQPPCAAPAILKIATTCFTVDSATRSSWALLERALPTRRNTRHCSGVRFHLGAVACAGVAATGWGRSRPGERDPCGGQYGSCERLSLSLILSVMR